MYNSNGDHMQSWSSGSSSPPLSDDGNSSSSSSNYGTGSNDFKIHAKALQIHQQNLHHYVKRGQRLTSTSDEGIVIDYNEEMPRKKRVS